MQWIYIGIVKAHLPIITTQDVLACHVPSLQPKDVLGCIISEEMKRNLSLHITSVLNRYGRGRGERGIVYV